MENRVKIILIGPGGIGKTTVRKVFFDQENPFAILETTLEPTHGEEITFYSLGKTMVIHDLAGQQIDEWLNESDTVFHSTDLIICMIDSQKAWNHSQLLVEDIMNVHERRCPDAKLVFFFHKIDLISTFDQQTLEKHAKAHLTGLPAKCFFTSIAKRYFIEMFKIITNLLIDVVVFRNQVNFSQIRLKSEIFYEFQQKERLSLQQLHELFKENDATIIQTIVEDLRAINYIDYLEAQKVYVLSTQGQKIKTEIEKQTITTISHQLPGLKYIKGLIIAERYGRVLFNYENYSGYFFKKFPSEDNNCDSIGSLVAMFYSAILSFSKNIDRNGLSSIVFAGSSAFTVIIEIYDLFAIFLLEGYPQVDQATLKTLQQMMAEINTETQGKMDLFLQNGIIGKELSAYLHNEIHRKLQRFDQELERLREKRENFSQEGLIDLYQRITQAVLPDQDVSLLKKLIVNYLMDRGWE